jgi:hypothetical protein
MSLRDTINHEKLLHPSHDAAWKELFGADTRLRGLQVMWLSLRAPGIIGHFIYSRSLAINEIGVDFKNLTLIPSK